MGGEYVELIRLVGEDFNANDDNADFRLSKEELRDVYEKRAKELELEISFEKFWDKCDKNDDNCVSFKEFILAVQQYYEAEMAEN
ncbi:hypothetical protein SNEBB_005094 [Seison nebaliae]|nr:hypothetical protein SNEBB_005094 [Seison nebaliae]